MKILYEIRDLLDTDGKIGEDQYKQRIFLNFFYELGYQDKEISFEDLIRGAVYDTDKFADVICGDILLEVKSSNKTLNKDVLKQAFQYNQGIGKNIVGVTNFKKFQFYNKSVNHLILEFNINNFEDYLHDIYRILGKHSFSTLDLYGKYDSRMEQFYKIKTMLDDYLKIYIDYNYYRLPRMFGESLALLFIFKKVFKN